MARLSEIVEKVKSKDTISGEQAEEQITLLGSIRDLLKLTNLQLHTMNKTLIDAMATERRNNDKLLLTFREAEMERKKEDLRGTAANPEEPPRGLNFGLGDLLIPAILAWQAGLDDVIQAITVVPTILKETSMLIGGKLLDGFKALKNAIGSLIAKPLASIIDSVRNGKFFGSIVDMFASLKTVFGVYILSPLEKIVDSIRKMKIVGPIIEAISRMASAITSFIIKPFESAVELIKSLKPFQTISNMFTSLSLSFDELNKTLGKVEGTVKSASKIGSLFKPLTELFGYLSRLVSNVSNILPIGKLLSKLPIVNVIFGVYDFVQGFLKGYNEEGLLTGIKEGIFEVVRGVVTKPLDLIKDVVSWAADKLGFASFSDILDGFSFTTLFDETIVPALNKFIGNFVTAAVGIIDGLKLLATGDFSASWNKLFGTSLEFFTNQAKWLYDNFIRGPLSWFFGDNVIRATEQTMQDVLGGAVDFFTNFPQWLYDNTVGPALNMFSGLFSSNENGPNAGLAQTPFQMPEMISNFGKWFYDSTIGPVADFITSWIPEGGVVAELERLLGDSLQIFKDLPGWIYKNTLEPITSLFSSGSETVSSLRDVRTPPGLASRGAPQLAPRPNENKPQVTIGQVIGSVNNSTGAGGSAPPSGNISPGPTNPLPNGYSDTGNYLYNGGFNWGN